MGVLKSTLNKLESTLQNIIEGRTARLFPPNLSTPDLATRLVAAMNEGIETDPNGVPIAPNLFSISLHPDRAASYTNNREWLDAMATLINEAGQEAGLIFTSPPLLIIVESTELSQDDCRVFAKIGQEYLSETDAHVIEFERDEQLFPENAFLIVDGTQIFPLNAAVVNIGRQEDNHLVIEDPRVSRQHAQLRVVKGRYMIFDLDSTGGTKVNGTLIQQQPLYPGDVISLSGVPLVFGQDPTGNSETQELSTNL